MIYRHLVTTVPQGMVTGVTEVISFVTFTDVGHRIWGFIEIIKLKIT